MALSGQNIVAELGKCITRAESLVQSLANLAETADRDPESNKKLFKHVLDVKNSEMFIASGGIWPAPYQYDNKIERRSLFWGRDAIIVETIIILARHLGLNVVEEGVETNEQFEFSLNNGCQIFQGYLFSKPLNKSEFSELLSTRQPVIKS